MILLIVVGVARALGQHRAVRLVGLELPDHLDLAAGLLGLAQLDRDVLQVGVDLPGDHAGERLGVAGEDPRRLGSA